MSRPLRPLIDRLRERTEYPESGCWIWTGPLNRPGGYGRVSIGDGRRALAHRAAYELLVGPIPVGLEIDHLCRTRTCWNPDHLEPVTGRVNTLRGEGHTALNAAKTHCVRGHELVGPNLYVHDGQRKCRACKRDALRSRRESGAGLRATSAPHGAYRYTLGCRCDICRAGNAAKQRKYSSRARVTSSDGGPADA